MLGSPELTELAGGLVAVRARPETAGVNWANVLFRAVFDRAVALVALLLLAPVFLAAALAIKLSSPGPVLFRQTRVGQHGREFRMLKFRTMVVDAEQWRAELGDMNEGAGVLFKIRRDPRVTPVGRVLRRLSIDELPQLFHVFSGRMALVGPRPPLPDEVAKYDREVARRLDVPPGLTGLWQVSGRSDLSWEDSVRLDLYYIDHWSPALDLSILARTASAVLLGRGAY